MHSDLGSRMKSYENSPVLEKGTHILRLDGKAFHTWTRRVGAIKPFSSMVSHCMVSATLGLAKEMQNFRLAYTQSDESTFLMENINEDSEAWFGGKVHKLESVSASIFSYHFNKRYDFYVNNFGYPDIPAYFDARVHSIPLEDAANNFVWRQQDWSRNSIQMLGQHYFTHSELQNKSNEEVRKMLFEAGVYFDDLNQSEKYGVFVYKNKDGYLSNSSMKLDYYQIAAVSGLDKYFKE